MAQRWITQQVLLLVLAAGCLGQFQNSGFQQDLLAQQQRFQSQGQQQTGRFRGTPGPLNSNIPPLPRRRQQQQIQSPQQQTQQFQPQFQQTQQFFDQPQQDFQQQYEEPVAPQQSLRAPAPAPAPARPTPPPNPLAKSTLSSARTKPTDYDDELIKQQNMNAQYSFSSAVTDGIMDNQQVREEVRDGLALKGMYSYSDGYYMRTVHYEADENGYRVVNEDVQQIGNGPQEDLGGRADVHSVGLGGSTVDYSITADDFVRRQPEQQDLLRTPVSPAGGVPRRPTQQQVQQQRPQQQLQQQRQAQPQLQQQRQAQPQLQQPRQSPQQQQQTRQQPQQQQFQLSNFPQQYQEDYQ